MTDNNPAKSSTPQPHKTLDESNFGVSEDPKTVFELNSQTLTNISVPAKDSLEGKTIGDNNRYLLRTLLGKGGMSYVYKALDTKFEDRIVAIKLMNNYANANNKHSIKRFMAEVKAISSLKHPNIIQIFDYGITSDEDPLWGFPFYVMEYLPGQTLQNLLQENKVVPLKSILKIISQICAGLKEAHQKGIIHRDLKPDNIFLVNGSGLGEIIKILDFGIAKNISSEGTTQTKLTQEGAFIGTYRYASPEQCRGLANIDQRTDIYSLGVILYEAICGKSPYDLDDDFSNSQADWMVCHIEVPPKPLKEQPGCQNLSDELVNIVMKCLAKSPENRFSDIENLLNALTKNFLVGIDLNHESVIDKKITHQPETKGNRAKTTLEVEPIYPETVLEKTNNQFSEDPNNNSPKISVGLLTAVMAFIIAMVGTIGYLGMFFLLEQPSKISHKSLTSPLNTDDNPKNINLLLDELTTQYQQGNYQDCYELARENPNRDNFLIQEWIGKCGLAAAKSKAELNSFSGAISIAKRIPNTVSNYQEIQDNINIWSGKILDYATKLYHQGKLDEAVKVTQIVPDNSNPKSQVTELISQWKQEESKHKTTIDNAQNLLNKGQWLAAKQEVEKIPTDFIFWREEARPILERANQKINELAAAQRNRRVQRKPPRVRVQRTRVRRQRQPARVQPKKTKPLPSLRERLKNAPLMDDRTLKERLKRN